VLFDPFLKVVFALGLVLTTVVLVLVLPTVALDLVLTTVALDLVLTTVALDLVLPTVALDLVLPTVALDLVLPTVALDLVLPTVALDLVLPTVLDFFLIFVLSIRGFGNLSFCLTVFVIFFLFPFFPGIFVLILTLDSMSNPPTESILHVLSVKSSL
jgi:hypothetical protein